MRRINPALQGGLIINQGISVILNRGIVLKWIIQYCGRGTVLRGAVIALRAGGGGRGGRAKAFQDAFEIMLLQKRNQRRFFRIVGFKLVQGHWHRRIIVQLNQLL